MNPELYLFDIAGTLMVDGAYARDAYRAVMAAHELDAEDDWLRSRMGRSKASVFAELLAAAGRDERDAPDLARAFESTINALLQSSPPVLIDGVDTMLERVRHTGARIGFTTGFAASTARIICEHFDWSFDGGVASDEVSNGRPAPDLIFEAMERIGVTDVRTVVTCGDTPNDLRAGDTAGCGWIIGVTCGTHRREELQPHPHTMLLDDYESFPACLAAHPPRIAANGPAT